MRLPPRGGAVCDGRVTDLHVEALNGSRRLRAGTRLRIGASAGAAREIEVASERGGSRAMARHMQGCRRWHRHVRERGDACIS